MTNLSLESLIVGYANIICTKIYSNKLKNKY